MKECHAAVCQLLLDEWERLCIEGRNPFIDTLNSANKDSVGEFGADMALGTLKIVISQLISSEAGLYAFLELQKYHQSSFAQEVNTWMHEDENNAN